VTAHLSARRAAAPAASDPALEAMLEVPLPRHVRAGQQTAVLCSGWCYHRHQDVERVELVIGGARQRPRNERMPRRDVLAATGETRGYLSGFWGAVPVTPRPQAEPLEVRVEVLLADGSRSGASLGAIPVTEQRGPSANGADPGREEPLIAVCMATYDPDIELFRAQVESLREQSDRNWCCLISDDRSDPERFEEIRRVVGEDLRFTVSRSERRLGFYRNFERALEMVPAEAALVALCDQDDRWYPEKLATLRASIGAAQLVCSDQRLVDVHGRVTAESLWRKRRPNHTNFSSLLIANTIVGASSLMRREVVDLALPFPTGPGWEFHDHWLALVAMATGEVAYVDEPLYDYVQHPGAVLGQVAFRAAGSSRPLRSRAQPLRRLLRAGRAAYFCGYLQLAFQAEVLRTRCGPLMTPCKRRALDRLLSCDRSASATAWLALRPLRELAGRNETLGAELLLLKGVLWRRLVGLWLRADRITKHFGSRRPLLDAAPPGCGPEQFEQRRLGRWLARR
jgi:hypothetical protein